MRLPAPFSTSATPSTWPTIADQTVAKIVARTHLVPRQDTSGGYCKAYCTNCSNVWGLTKAKQAVIWAFGGLIIMALGVAIGYLWRKHREKLRFSRQETKRKEARQQVRDRDATIATLQVRNTKLEGDTQKSQKGKGWETTSSSSHAISNCAGPLNTTPAENRRKREVKDNGIVTDPASDPTAKEFFPVKTAPKVETLASGALQASPDPLSDESLPRSIVLSSTHAPDGPSIVDPEPQKPVNQRLDGVARRTQPPTSGRRGSHASSYLSSFIRPG